LFLDFGKKIYILFLDKKNSMDQKLRYTIAVLSISPIHRCSTTVRHRPLPSHHRSISVSPPQNFKLIFAEIKAVFAQIEVLQKARSCVFVEFVQARGL